MAYYKRHIDDILLRWKDEPRRKPLLIRGARQVGKSSAVRQFGRTFKYFIEVNLERQPSLAALFTDDIDVRRICTNISAAVVKPIVAGETLLFIDEIQVSKQAIMALRYFKEDYPDLHVIAAGSLLEFALEDIPSFGVGRIRSLYMYPFSFDEFLSAQGLQMQVDFKKRCNASNPLNEAIHKQLIAQVRSYYLVGGMPAAVNEWVETNDYIACSHIHADIIDSYQDDFAKYKRRISPVLLRQVWRSVALQAGRKFVFSEAAGDVRSTSVRESLHLLTLAGLIVPTIHTDGNGIPLGAETNVSFIKYLFLDVGLMLNMLKIPAADMLLASDVDLVNEGAVSEVFAGLELMKYSDCYQRPELYYWQHMSRNGNAEVDYLRAKGSMVLPLEVKANTRGSMQSLYLFMRKKHLTEAVRSSLENFGQLEYTDKEDGGAQRHVRIVPLYALSSI